MSIIKIIIEDKKKRGRPPKKTEIQETVEVTKEITKEITTEVVQEQETISEHNVNKFFMYCQSCEKIKKIEDFEKCLCCFEIIYKGHNLKQHLCSDCSDEDFCHYFLHYNTNYLFKLCNKHSGIFCFDKLTHDQKHQLVTENKIKVTHYSRLEKFSDVNNKLPHMDLIATKKNDHILNYKLFYEWKE